MEEMGSVKDDFGRFLVSLGGVLGVGSWNV